MFAKSKKTFLVVFLLLILSISSIIICPWLGLKILNPFDVLKHDDLFYVFTMIRIPRTLAAFFAGGGLAIAGMVYQAIFRNSLADPYTLGVSSGASLGAALCIVFGLGGAVAGMSFVSLGAFTGAIIAIAFIYALAWSGEHNSHTLLLAGVIVATVCSGLIMFLHLIGGLHRSFQILRWIMGGVDGISFSILYFMLIPVILYIGMTWLFLPILDHFLTGDHVAHSRGIAVNKYRLYFIISTALAVGAIVSVCGPIGFVGVLAPHTCRMLITGIRHRTLALCSFLLGGSFLVITDTLARSVVPPAEIPVGIITALVGGPFFLLVLYRRKKHLML